MAAGSRCICSNMNGRHAKKQNKTKTVYYNRVTLMFDRGHIVTHCLVRGHWSLLCGTDYWLAELDCHRHP